MIKLRTITDSAEYTRKDNTFLVTISTREVTQAEYDYFVHKAVISAQSAMLRVLDKGGYHSTAIHHPRLGPIGIFSGDSRCGLRHIQEERDEAFQRTPLANAEPAETMMQIAEAAVLGTPTYEMYGQPKTSSPRLNIIYNKYQIIVAPFWANAKETQHPLPVHEQPAWVITGYQMEFKRQQDMASWICRPESQIKIVKACPVMTYKK